MSVVENFKLRGFQDLLSPKKWWIYVRFFFNKTFKKGYDEFKNRHELEQIVYRMSHPGCRECVLKGACVHCGCKSPELFYDRTNYCSGEHWNEMMSKESWEEFKTMYGISIDEDYLEQVSKQGIITKWHN